MDTQVMTPNTMFPSGQTGAWFRPFRDLVALKREADTICAKIDRELPIAEARANRLMRLYGL